MAVFILPSYICSPYVVQNIPTMSISLLINCTYDNCPTAVVPTLAAKSRSNFSRDSVVDDGITSSNQLTLTGIASGDSFFSIGDGAAILGTVVDGTDRQSFAPIASGSPVFVNFKPIAGEVVN